jgi:hypothetical protein
MIEKVPIINNVLIIIYIERLVHLWSDSSKPWGGKRKSNVSAGHPPVFEPGFYEKWPNKVYKKMAPSRILGKMVL